MMTTTIIITVCVLLLLAYIFDISSPLTRIPSVILLLILGVLVKFTVQTLQINIPDLNPLLPIFGTIGLILIVLEGALELELNKSKMELVKISSLMALAPIVILAFALAWAFSEFAQVPFKTALTNAIPFCVISSAIAIPSVKNLTARNKEFVVYESCLSDIFGVVLFNFVAYNEVIDANAFSTFGLQLLAIILISFVSVLGVSFLLSRIRHHITYTPIILSVILIYAVSKIYHLPGLIFILVFGLFLGNLDELRHMKWIEKLRPEKLDREVAKFKEITVEATFLIRALFFLLFGFLMDIGEILNYDSLPWAFAIAGGVLVVRSIFLFALKMPVFPLLFVAPRGLITILLFLAILPAQSIPLVNKSLVIQSIVISVFLMMIGLMLAKSEK